MEKHVSGPVASETARSELPSKVQEQADPQQQRRKSPAREAKLAHNSDAQKADHNEPLLKPVPAPDASLVSEVEKHPQPQRRKSPGRPKKLKANANDEEKSQKETEKEEQKEMQDLVEAE